MEIYKAIEKYLPTKASRAAVVLTLPVATGGYFIVDSLRPLLSFWQDETFTMFKVVIFLLLSLIGCFIIIGSLIHHVNTRDVQITIRNFRSDDIDNEG
jgi:hypothetical protein